MSEHLNIMPSLRISSSGLDAQQRRMEVIANNIANSNSSPGADGRVFRRKQAVFAEKLSEQSGKAGGARLPEGVAFKGVEEDQGELKKIFKPNHPDADSNGYVTLPNVNPVEEMVDMMSAVRSYEANLAAIKAAKQMAEQALGISK
jgi:flagellar basal-body rod protein FlgC